MTDDNPSIHPAENQKSAEDFIKSLSPSDVKRLEWLLGIIGKIDGWCAVNRWIGKYLIIGGIGLLILFSQGLDAIKNLIWWKH